MPSYRPPRVLLWSGIACLAAPLSAQVVVTPLPFGQRNTMVTALPFGQRSVSPLRPLAKRVKPATVAAMVGTVVAQWNMNETSGSTMLDSSGNGNNGTLYNVGLTGAGYTFDGTSSKVVVPNSASLVPQSNDFSYSVQFQTSRVPPAGTDYDLIRKGTSASTGGEFKLEIVYNRGVGKPKCVVLDSLGNSASERGNQTVTDGQPHTVTCTKTGNTLTQQVDSFAPTSGTGTLSGPITTIKPLTIGVKAPTATGIGADWYTGTMFSATVSVAQ